MTFPVFFSNYSVQSIVRFTLLNIWFFKHTVEILMERVQQEVEELLRIMLI